MIFSELREYLRLHKRAALQDMAVHFRTDADALRGMLNKWIAKGHLQKLPSGTMCGGGCCRCDPASLEIYEWQD